MLLSTVFGNTDLQNLMVGLHILSHTSDSHHHEHERDSHSHGAKKAVHHHSHAKNEIHQQSEPKVIAASHLNKSPFKLTHQHDDDDSHGDGEPHDHTFSVGAPFVSFLNDPYVIELPSLDDLKVMSAPVDRYAEEPYLKGLFRPPIV